MLCCLKLHRAMTPSPKAVPADLPGMTIPKCLELFTKFYFRVLRFFILRTQKFFSTRIVLRCAHCIFELVSAVPLSLVCSIISQLGGFGFFWLLEGLFQFVAIKNFRIWSSHMASTRMSLGCCVPFEAKTRKRCMPRLSILFYSQTSLAPTCYKRILFFYATHFA